MTCATKNKHGGSPGLRSTACLAFTDSFLRRSAGQERLQLLGESKKDGSVTQCVMSPAKRRSDLRDILQQDRLDDYTPSFRCGLHLPKYIQMSNRR